MLSGCNPLNLMGTGSLLHSFITNNTVGMATGTVGIAVEETTGKSPLEHVIGSIDVSPKKEKLKSKKVIWLYD